MLVSTEVPEQCVSDNHDGCVHQMHMKDNQARSKAHWSCGHIGHFHKDCITILLTQDVDRKDKSLSDTSPTIGHMSHTLTVSNVHN